MEALCHQILEARTPQGRLLLAEQGCSFEAVRAAYKRLLHLHPDKTGGNALAAEAFKVVTSAFNELQARHERRGSGAAQPSAAAGGAGPEQGQHSSRWGAFTARPAWAGAGAAAQADAAKPAPDGPGPVPAVAKPSNNRWGRPAADYGMYKPSTMAPVQQQQQQQARPAQQQRWASPQEGQENSRPLAGSPSSGWDSDDVPPSQPRQSLPADKAGVPPSAFYARSRGPQQRPQQVEQQPKPCSLYSMFAVHPVQRRGSTGSTTAAAPAPQRLSPQPPLAQQPGPAASYAPAAECGSKWGSSKNAALLGMLRQPAPPLGATAAVGPANADQLPAGGAGRGSGKQAQQWRRAQVLESSESEDAIPSQPSECSSGSDSLSSGSMGGASEDGAAGAAADHSDLEDTASRGPGEVQQAAGQQPTAAEGEDPAVVELQVAVQRHQAGALLAAQGLGAAVIQAGRKQALQRHYKRRGSGRQKRSAGVQAKLQLVAVASKKVSGRQMSSKQRK